MTSPVPEDQKVVYNFLGNSGLKVSNICLGCGTLGENQYGFLGWCNEEQSFQLLNRFREWGGNFLDTADVYGLGNSEKMVGKWLETQSRDSVIVATKCRGNMGTQSNVNNVGLSRRHIFESIHGSLERLRTNFVDLYQIHSWDDGTPLEETFRTLNDLVRQGKVRYVGLSNVTGWQLQQIVDLTSKLGMNSVVSLQQQYNLLCRESEWEPFQVCKSQGLAVLPWSPLKGGVLSGKVRRGQTPTEGRMSYIANNPEAEKRSPFSWSALDDRAFTIIETTRDLAASIGRTVAQVSLRWLLQKDVVPSVVIGARTLQQLDDNMAAANGWRLTLDQMKQLDDVSAPRLPYPYEMIFERNADRIHLVANDFYVRSTGS